MCHVVLPIGVTAGAHVLAVGAGTGILALTSAAAGSGEVTALERSKMMYHMAKQAVKANRWGPEGADQRQGGGGGGRLEPIGRAAGQGREPGHCSACYDLCLSLCFAAESQG